MRRTGRGTSPCTWPSPSCTRRSRRSCTSPRPPRTPGRKFHRKGTVVKHNFSKSKLFVNITTIYYLVIARARPALANHGLAQAIGHAPGGQGLLPVGADRGPGVHDQRARAERVQVGQDLAGAGGLLGVRGYWAWAPLLTGDHLED